MRKRVKIILNKEEMDFVTKIQNDVAYSISEKAKARVLLKIHYNNTELQGLRDADIAASEHISHDTMTHLKNKYLDYKSIEMAIRKKPRKHETGRIRIPLESKNEVIMIAESIPPEGQKKWTYRSICKFYNDLKPYNTISHTTVMNILKQRQEKL
jgi:hypothetical protein